MNHKTIVIAGANGFLGQLLSRHFLKKGWSVTGLVRPGKAVAPGARAVQWDATHRGNWEDALEGADLLVNLCGRSVNCRYNTKNRRDILESRVRSTELLGAAVASRKEQPKVWINAASATIYRHSEDRPMDEIAGEIGSGFSVEVCKAWEEAFFKLEGVDSRRVALRLAMVMAPGRGGVYHAFQNLARNGLGGTMGNGRQYVSWIEGSDFCRAVQWITRCHELDGVVNCAAPNPLPNRDFMQELRNALGQLIGLPAPRIFLEVGALVLRTETELLLKSRRVVPARLLEQAFHFEYPTWAEAVQKLVNLAQLHELKDRRKGFSREQDFLKS